MVQKVSRYRTLDGKEFVAYDDAVTHERGLKLVSDVRDTIIDTMNSVVDGQNRKVYNVDLNQASTLADMLVMTDLYSRLKPMLKDLS
jgi:hypothetical protein